MSCDFIALANKGVQSLRPYEPGKPIEDLERELGIESIIKLASNENPRGPSQSVQAAVAKALEEVNRYPDGNGFLLKAALSSKLGLNPEQLVLGNGSSDLLDFVARCFIEPGSDAVISQHAFAIYELVIRAAGGNPIVAPAKDWGHDLEAMAAAITSNTRLIYVTNPNNPTGTWVAEQELVVFLEKVPEHIVVLLDEAYFEYVTDENYPNGMSLLGRFPNLVVTRTFSKAYGLSGLRVGFGAMSAELAELINRVRPPFNVTNVGLAAATAALEDETYINESVRLNTAGMQQFESGFKTLGLSYVPSAANFVSVEVGPQAAEIYQALLHEGVIVRPIGGYQMPNHLRISIGLPEENQRCLDALCTVLQK